MKTQSIFRKLFFSSLAIIIIAAACSKKRLEKKEETPKDTYSSMQSFYDKNKQEEQEYVIDTPGNCPLIAKMGTKICVSNDMFMFPDSTDVTYPFILKIVEIYPVKDIILWELPTVAGGKILESAAQIRVRTFKNNIELVLKPGRKYPMELDTMPNLVNGMKVYYGFDAGNIVDWTDDVTSISSITVDTMSAVFKDTFSYKMFVAKMGWVDCAKLSNISSTTTTITFSASGNGTENIDIFLVFKNFNSVMQVYNLASGQVPVGENVTVIAMALNQNNQYVLHKEDITVTANHQITLNMQVISEADLLNTLDGL